MHLKRFAIPASPQRIVVYDKEWKTAKDKAPKGQAYERDLYTLNAGKSCETTRIEDGFLKKIDNDAAPALDRLIAGTLDDKDRAVIALYASSLIVRNPTQIEKRRQNISRIATEMYRRAHAHSPEFKRRARHDFETDEEFQKFWNATAPDQITVTGNREYAMTLGMKDPRPVARAIFGLPWVLLTATAETFFVLADDPVFCCNPRTDMRSPVGLLASNCETILPLSSRVCLVITAEQSSAFTKRDAADWQISEINLRSAYASTRRFFGCAICEEWKQLMGRFAKWDGKADFIQAPNFDVSIQAAENNLFRPLFT